MPNEIAVPLLDLKAQYATIRDEIGAAMTEVLDSQYFILGPVVKQLEADIAEYCKATHAIGCASGSDAILLPLMAIGVGPGDEVICPPFTFFSTAGSIWRLGAKPVFVDIDPVTYNMDPAHLREVASKCTRLKAIMPVHLFGQSADLDAILPIADEFGVPVIEDAAQAIGTRDAHGDPIGTRGQVGCFSFFPSKNLGAFGDGGIMTTNDDAFGDTLSKLRVHGGHTKYHHDIVGMNSRLDALQAAILRVKLRHLESWHEGRRRNAAYYDKAFADAGAMDSRNDWTAGGLPLRTPYALPEPARHIYNQYVIRVPADLRDDLRDHLRGQDIGCEIYYPVPLHLQKCFSELGGREGDFPVSESAAKEVLALPIYPDLTEAQLARVAHTVVTFVGERAAAVTG